MTSVWRARGRTAAHHAKSGEDEANAKKGEGSRLGDRRRRRSQEAVVARAVAKVPDDLGRVVDAQDRGKGGAGKWRLGGRSREQRRSCPERSVRKAAVESGGGVAGWGKVPPVSRRQWRLVVPSLKEPTICAAPLMPQACVKSAPGTSIWVKV